MKISRFQRTVVSSSLAAGLFAAGALRSDAASQQPFFLHNGDTVVFYGDSITEQQMYPRDIETFVDTRFPKMHVKFINSGWSGDRVTGGGGGGIDLRLKRDVINYKPTVVTIFLGMNDGAYTKYDENTFQTYKNGLIHIIDSLKASLPGVRISLLTPSYYDRNVKKWGSADYNATLVVYTDFVKHYAFTHNIPVADENEALSSAIIEGEKTDPNFAVSGDGVHPDEVGHLIMAAAVLNSWNAPPIAQDLVLQEGVPTTVTSPLPWPFPDSARKALDVSFLPKDLDVFQVSLPTPKNFTPADADAKYGLYVDGTFISTVPANADGSVTVDLNQFPNLPQEKQAQTVLGLVEKRVDLWHGFWQNRGIDFVSPKDVPTEAELRKLSDENKSLDTLRDDAHNASQPLPHTFLLKKM